MLAVGAVASTGPPPAPQARRASHRLLARPQAWPVAIQWPVVRDVHMVHMPIQPPDIYLILKRVNTVFETIFTLF